MPYDSAITLLGIYQKKPETLIQKSMCTPIFIAVLFTIAKIWKPSKSPSLEGGVKAVVHLHNGILLSCKTEGNFTFCNSMAGPTGMLNETGQSEKDKYHMISLTCGI